MNSKQRFRTRIIGVLILIGAGVLLSSVYTTSIVKGEYYSGKAQAQYQKPLTTLFSRGTIYFTGKDGTESSAATVGSGYHLYMNPKLVSDAAGAYEALSHYVGLDKNAFLGKARKTNDPYEELLSRLDEATADSIKSLGLSGIGLVRETWRSYPGGSLAAHELGIIGESATSSTVTGKYGLERSYNNVLSRQGQGGSVNAFAEVFSGLSSVFGNAEEGDLKTTIEPTVEAYLEKILAETQKSWNPDSIGGIVMDPNTGEIVAMSSLPSFDPNNLKGLKSASVLSNPLAEHVYEMGSIVKPLTMALALDAGAVKPSSTYDDVGCMPVDDKKICNYDQRARGITSMQEILSQSLNIGVATIALKTGGTDFVKYFRSFGIDSKSGIDLPNEATPLAGNLKKPTDVNIVTASYGQGIAVSPVGMTRALAVIANGGYLVTPHLVKEIEYSNGSTKEVKPSKIGPVLKKETVDSVRKMLVTVVDTALAKGTIKKEHYSLAAKTGTAEIADPVNGGYYKDRYLHSFFGFFPAYDPKFIVFLYQIHPKGATYASETLVRPFDDIATFLLNYYNVPPDR